MVHVVNDRKITVIYDDLLILILAKVYGIQSVEDFKSRRLSRYEKNGSLFYSSDELDQALDDYMRCNISKEETVADLLQYRDNYEAFSEAENDYYN